MAARHLVKPAAQVVAQRGKVRKQGSSYRLSRREDDFGRIEVLPAPQQAEVKVRSGGQPCGSDLADHFALRY